jgi:phosphatidylserine decarboxylase
MVTLLQSRSFGTLAMVEVGALTVGTIVQTYRPGPVLRGAEKGLFRYGGSTVVLLVEAGRVEIDPDLLAWSAVDRPAPIETLVRMGTSIGVSR